MSIDEAIAYFGNGNKLCKALKISRTNITNWRKIGYIPLFQQYRLERITKSELRADKDE